MQQAMYPVQFSVDYPDRALDRLTTFFRLFMAIPIAIVLGAVAGGTWQWTNGTWPGGPGSGRMAGQQRSQLVLAVCCSSLPC